MDRCMDGWHCLHASLHQHCNCDDGFLIVMMSSCISSSPVIVMVSSCISFYRWLTQYEQQVHLQRRHRRQGPASCGDPHRTAGGAAAATRCGAHTKRWSLIYSWCRKGHHHHHHHTHHHHTHHHHQYYFIIIYSSSSFHLSSSLLQATTRPPR